MNLKKVIYSAIAVTGAGALVYQLAKRKANGKGENEDSRTSDNYHEKILPYLIAEQSEDPAVYINP
jgi:hypothetical protein